MFAWTRQVALPPFGFYVIAVEIYAFVAAALALNEVFIAPISLIFFAIDHTEFMIVIVAVLCGVDFFLKRTAVKGVIFAIALLPLLGVIAVIIAKLLR
jgi:hypothetical protein